VPQVALLYSTEDHYRHANGLFPRDLSSLKGTLQDLLESQLSVVVVSEHHLAGRMAEYPLIVVPECGVLEPGFKDELVSYVRGGGNLLLVGPQAAALFEPELGIALESEPSRGPAFLDHRGAIIPIQGRRRFVKLGREAQRFGRLLTSKESSSSSWPAASLNTLGKGKIAATYFDFSKGYLADRNATARTFLNELARKLFPEPLVEVKGSPDVDVILARIGGRLAVNLVNTAGPHADVSSPILDSIPPVGPLELAIRMAARPKSVTLEPGGQALGFEYRDGVARATVSRLDIHGVVVIE
jgi:hypothetical protein